jgi:hypothetical protein
MKRDLGNFTRGSQLIEHFGFMFAAGLKGPLIISLIVMCWMTWWAVSEGMSDHEVYLAWMHVYGAGYRFMEFDPAHDVTVPTAWGRAVTFSSPCSISTRDYRLRSIPRRRPRSDAITRIAGSICSASRIGSGLGPNRGAMSWSRSPCS